MKRLQSWISDIMSGLNPFQRDICGAGISPVLAQIQGCG